MSASCSCATIYHRYCLTETTMTDNYTLSLHDALPISLTSSNAQNTPRPRTSPITGCRVASSCKPRPSTCSPIRRSEEHTSELQSRLHLVCRLLLDKKNRPDNRHSTPSS